MDIRSIKRFLALNKHRSFSRASEALAISQPSLTREIQKMEEDIGSPLFIRLPSGVELSPTGEIYFHCFRKIVKELETAMTACQSLKEKIFGNIQLATHPIIGQTILPRIEKELSSAPALNIQYHFHSSREAIQRVTNYEVDFAIVASTFKHADIKKIRLWTEQIELYSRSGKLEPTILANQNMLHAEKILKKTKQSSIRWINDYRVLQEVLSTNSFMGLLPNKLVHPGSSLKSLKKFTPAFEISLIYRTDLEKTGAHKWFIETLKNQCDDL